MQYVFNTLVLNSVRILILFLFNLFALIAPGALLAAQPLTVFAAASLKGALDDVAAQFQQRSGHPVTTVFAGTSVLARQISQGAPADVFISANPDWMDELEDKEHIDADTRIRLASNQLTLIGHESTNSTVDWETFALEPQQRLALALTEAVPAGIYAKAAMQTLGLWNDLRPHLVQTDNVRAALRLVELGEVEFGIVYSSDLRAAAVHLLAHFPEASHPPIIYPAAVTARSHHPAAREFLAFMTTTEVIETLIRHGFKAPDTTPIPTSVPIPVSEIVPSHD